MNAIIKENKSLKNNVPEMELKIKSLEKEKQKNNLVFFGVGEIGKSERELDHIKDTTEELGVQMNCQEISNVYRVGKKTENKTDQS